MYECSIKLMIIHKPWLQSGMKGNKKSFHITPCVILNSKEINMIWVTKKIYKSQSSSPLIIAKYLKKKKEERKEQDEAYKTKLGKPHKS